jgi:hypothetical protein
LRTGLVHRQGAELQTPRVHQEQADRHHQTGMPRDVPRRDRVQLQVSDKLTEWLLALKNLRMARIYCFNGGRNLFVHLAGVTLPIGCSSWIFTPETRSSVKSLWFCFCILRFPDRCLHIAAQLSNESYNSANDTLILIYGYVRSVAGGGGNGGIPPGRTLRPSSGTNFPNCPVICLGIREKLSF